jgi:hypothetical protein
MQHAKFGCIDPDVEELREKMAVEKDLQGLLQQA